MMEYVLRSYEELYHTIIKGAIEGRKLSAGSRDKMIYRWKTSPNIEIYPIE